MKKFILFLMTLLLIFAFCSCSKLPDSESEPNTANFKSEQNTANDAYEANTANKSESTEETTKTVMGRSYIYAIYDANTAEPETNVCSYKGTDCTPDRLAAGLASWTGLKFRTHSEVDEKAKKITVDFLADSAFTTGEDMSNDVFTFENTEAMRWFMLNSLYKSIKENIGDYDVYFTVDGKDIATLKLSGKLSSSQPFNKTEDSHIYKK